MAEIEQIPGTLNISQMVKGEAMSFQTVHAGDLTADIFVATINNAGTAVNLTVTKSYSSPNTTVSYTLSAADSATLVESLLPWKVVQTSGGVPRTIIAGTWGVASWK